MRINYLDYQEDLFTRVINNELPVVYVFNNPENILQARKYDHRPFLESESAFLTMRDLKEKIFPVDRLILREEKRVIIFYELITEEEKGILQINDYFSAIELANEFFTFYDELNEYETEELTGLQEWQQQKYQILKRVRNRYLVRMKELNYSDETLAFSFNNFSDYFLKDYEEIVFVNIINFTPKEKRLLQLLEKKSFRLQLYLQLNPADFNEKDLRLKTVSLPEVTETVFRLYYTEEDLLQLANLISLVEDDRELSILESDPDSPDHRLLAADRISGNQEIGFTETRIFRFLEALYELLLGAERGKVQLHDLLEAVYLPEFRDYYQLDISSIESLQELARDDYTYFSVKDCGLEEFRDIMDDLQQIGRVRDFKDLALFLKNINLDRLDDRFLSGNTTCFYDALLELRTLEEMKIVSSWSRYFQDRSRGLLKMFLNYLRYKKVREIKEEKEIGVKMGLLRGAPHLKRDRLVILNASRGVLPGESSSSFLLTDRQRAKVGLPVAEEKRLEEKYLFFRHLFSSKEVIIFSLRNLERNLTTSSFVDELRLKYGLRLEEMDIKAIQLPGIIEGIFPDQSGGFILKGNNGSGEDNLIIEKEDFGDQAFSLTYYKHRTLSTCPYKFYLEVIAGLEERVRIKKEISARLLGIIVHEIFRDVIRQTGSDLVVTHQLIVEVIEHRLAEYSLKINSYYLKYYQDILFNKIKDSIYYFFRLLERKTGGEIENFKTEWKPVRTSFYQDKLVDLYLNGRIDLLIELKGRKQIIDFKTGAGDREQLDFYALLINPEADQEVKIERWIYDVMREKDMPGVEGSEADLALRMGNNLRDFFAEGRYTARYRKSICNRCCWVDICRVVSE